jgi:hypothetical protein
MFAEILNPDVHRISFQDDYVMGCLCFGTDISVPYTPYSVLPYCFFARKNKHPRSGC